MTFAFGATSAEEVVALASFTTILQMVFAQRFDIDVPRLLPVPVRATTASAILIAFSATGSGMRRGPHYGRHPSGKEQFRNEVPGDRRVRSSASRVARELWHSTSKESQHR